MNEYTVLYDSVFLPFLFFVYCTCTYRYCTSNLLTFDLFFFFVQRACWGRESRHTDTVKVFLKNGVPPGQPSDEGTCADMTGNEGTKAALLEIQENYEL